MKKIQQTLNYEDDSRYELTANLSAWHKLHPLADQGVDFDFKLMWATMTDQDCLAFCLLHPQWSSRFTQV